MNVSAANHVDVDVDVDVKVDLDFEDDGGTPVL